ncbi:MAG TPA: V-type ATPase 116kDa subunit family protein [Acidothermaceae bacterium]|nr:V-type ATPase 116kDa subunit family protein [Acidothermaceae bacterium]
MPSRDGWTPIAMRRIGLLAPGDAARDLLVRVAQAGVVQLPSSSLESVTGPASALLQHTQQKPQTGVLAAQPPDLRWCQTHDRLDLVAGEAELEAVAETGIRRGEVIGFVGWAPANTLAELAADLAPVGGAVVAIRRPRGSQPPTLLADVGARHAFAPLVETYATPPYRDLDVSVLAGLAYVAMFGMMFADVGHGALLLVIALTARFGHWRRLQMVRSFWVMVAAAGASSMVFGALYGECFGPTHAFPVLWISPLDQPVRLLVVAIAVGALLLAAAYAVASVNRFREGGWRAAIYASSGIAGATTFAGLGLMAAGLYIHVAVLIIGGALMACTATGVAFVGLFVEAGGGLDGAAQAGVESFDIVVRLGSNVVSFARLAAFGMTHAALGQVVWQSTVGAGRHGPFGLLAAAVIFIAGNAVTFSLEALIAGVQALRLEYYELFSRVFVAEGEPFRPWHLAVESSVPVAHSSLEASCPVG